ncbi:dihydrolipoamide:NAD oxidoreductase [Cavenderia fasciculata]|uniref:Dihydrolipoyl dehydrogenase n=1 Tax=Cavenderia fasciculata TaxID=261658 RepID=F4PK29_CACFS|nr:dihydrolipoamide:NAD oxidoreductase [Cavenderia fasciculata]EGG23953.1 dihydrolipoamide:NAD oxidoreductase [Cavenderia fasciculata]|eukprot:XP_004361804.1 dihydrolipoamide:NAD oxidoreductase [Cavenderia fasciculata]
MLRQLNRLNNPVRLGLRYYSTAEQQDVVIIGGGPGGYVAGIKAGQLGMKVTVVEKRGKLGGTCLNVGCIPSKALLNASHMYEDAKTRFSNYGVKVGSVEVSVADMMKYKEKSVNGLTSGIEGLFKKNKVSYSKGHGSIVSPNQVEVTAADGTKSVINTKNIVIATGSDVVSLPGLVIDEKQIVSSTGALSLTTVPKRLVVIGGGVIGLELGSVWSRLGSETTVVEFTPRIAAGADGEVAKKFQRTLEKQHIKFHLETKVTGVTKNADGTVSVNTESVGGSGHSGAIVADVVLVSVGRRPQTQQLGLEKVGVATDKAGRVEVDENFRSNVQSVFAIGDAIKGPMLAHKAEEEGIACIEYLHNGGGHVNYGAIPSVIYTHPEVAWVGKTEEELVKEGAKFKVGKFPFMANSRARTNDDTEGFVKMLSDVATDRILGVHIMGANAGEMIAESVLAVEYGASTEDIARTCHAHPTLSEAVKECAMEKPIHF